MKLAVKEGPIQYTDHSQSQSNFLALSEMFASMDMSSTYQILDLGPARQSNIQFLSKYRCKVFIEDLYRCMHDNPFDDEVENETIHLERHLQDYPDDTRFDAILVWDLFDYLDVDQIQGLITYLSPYCKHGTRLFAVTSSSKEIPATPSSFTIIDAGTLNYEASTSDLKTGPGFNQTRLSRLLNGFQLKRAFRMSSGVEETLFEFCDQ